jgi:hypothetical protein
MFGNGLEIDMRGTIIPYLRKLIRPVPMPGNIVLSVVAVGIAPVLNSKSGTDIGSNRTSAKRV